MGWQLTMFRKAINDNEAQLMPRLDGLLILAQAGVVVIRVS